MEYGAVAFELGCRFFEYVVRVLGSPRYGFSLYICLLLVKGDSCLDGLGCRVDADGPMGEENFPLVHD